MKMPLRRGLLWAFLVAALLVVAAATLLQWLRRPEPLPVYGKLPAFSLVNRDGRTIRLEDLAGAPWVADFIFTRCPASCPMMSARMARLEGSLPDVGVLLVSVSVDPAYDTPEVLEHYARKLQAPERWLFLTGEREDVRRLSIEGFKLGLDMDPPPGMAGPEPILHSTRFVLVDGEGQIRGYYEAFDEASTEKLRKDLLRLVTPLS
ncbi:MAG TPA: SCO family protein [Thermoanaerobaculia bacterium]|nr:SCO family protein [Thermoanaerobaculia bacterium]